MPRTIVITGATRGIGLVTVRELAHRHRDATFVLLARPESGAAAVTTLLDDGVRAEFVPADLRSLEQRNSRTNYCECPRLTGRTTRRTLTRSKQHILRSTGRILHLKMFCEQRSALARWRP